MAAAGVVGISQAQTVRQMCVSFVLHRKRLSLARWQVVLLLSAYIGLVLNSAVIIRQLARPVSSSASLSVDWPVLSWTLVSELALVFSFTAFVLNMADLFGKYGGRFLILMLIGISVIASYYMTLFNVVIGYGVVQAVLTTDVDLSKEAAGIGLLVWFVALAVIPAAIWWRYVAVTPSTSFRTHSLLRSWLKKLFFTVLIAFGLLFIVYWMNSGYKNKVSVGQEIGPASRVVHTYLPTNWIVGVAMSASNTLSGWISKGKKTDLSKIHGYASQEGMDDVTLVVVIGESARASNFGLLGYDRATTPMLLTEKNLVALRGTSCNTSTKLSLQCMFVRPQGVVDNGFNAPRILEESVFSVLKTLGYKTELFAMQSEVWFYNSLGLDFYKIREVIVAADANRGKPALDMLLGAELSASLEKHPLGRRAIILHTKGSHFSYASRYSSEFGKYWPTCDSIDGMCTKDRLINAYDNSILYTDAFLHDVMHRLANKKALLVYTSDHGESIDENRHFHATPKLIAPKEQFDVPLFFWASEPFLESSAANRLSFERLRLAAQSPSATFGHANLFDSVLGCLGVKSSDGGIDPRRNLCQ